MKMSNLTEREEYFEYLNYVQPSGTPEPIETHEDWTGGIILSFQDWIKKHKNTNIED